MTKSPTELIIVGQIAGAHGVRGDVRVKSFTADPEALFAYGPLLSETGAILIEPKSVRPAKDHFVVTPQKPLEKEDWDRLKGTRLFVPRGELPKADEDEFYVEDLVGLEVRGERNDKLGRVKAVLNHGAGDVIEIEPAIRGKSVLVPFTLEDVPGINLDAGYIVVATFDVWADETRPGPGEDER
ncbi:MAG: ribosome maturation factor RimM [Henriciella sp.]|nr:ribosome maturation factor RimM [Henriciella sp.]